MFFIILDNMNKNFLNENFLKKLYINNKTSLTIKLIEFIRNIEFVAIINLGNKIFIFYLTTCYINSINLIYKV